MLTFWASTNNWLASASRTAYENDFIGTTRMRYKSLRESEATRDMFQNVTTLYTSSRRSKSKPQTPSDTDDNSYTHNWYSPFHAVLVLWMGSSWKSLVSR